MPNGGGEPGREGQKVFVPHWLRDQQPGLRQAGFAARVASEKTQGPVQVDPSQVVQEPGEKSADFQARLAKAKQFPGQFRAYFALNRISLFSGGRKQNLVFAIRISRKDAREQSRQGNADLFASLLLCVFA